MNDEYAYADLIGDESPEKQKALYYYWDAQTPRENRIASAWLEEIEKREHPLLSLPSADAPYSFWLGKDG
jgi:hypothetical protein